MADVKIYRTRFPFGVHRKRGAKEMGDGKKEKRKKEKNNNSNRKKRKNIGIRMGDGDVSQGIFLDHIRTQSDSVYVDTIGATHSL